MHVSNGKLTKNHLTATQTFENSLNLMPNLVVVFTTTVEETITRRGGEGKIVTKAFLQQYNEQLIDFGSTLFPKPIMFDTTGKSPNIVSEFLESTIKKNYNK